MELLKQVQKPGRYIGGEHNSVTKDWGRPYVRFLLAFPDIYEVGMSYLGMRILYGILNERGDALCERVFSVWPDMEKLLRQWHVPLFSLESKRPLNEFDIIGFSLTYDLNYTNVLNILDLGGIPLRSRDRSDEDPLVIAGGPAAYNPEPMADFIDAFVIGEGEEVIVEILEAYQRNQKPEHRNQRADRKKMLSELAKIEGVYVPSLYEVEYNGDGTIKKFAPKNSAPPIVRKRVVKDLNSCFYPVKQVVPYIQIVHDRICLEIMRGCKHFCKFCQAGVVCLPRRERSREKIVELAKEVYRNTGYEEMSLMSLSSGDHSRIKEIFEELTAAFKERGVSVSLPSLRIEGLADELPELIRRVRKSGLTFAPESGSERLRKVINKNIDIELLARAALEAYKAGWDRIKLYFMIGLPQESDEDLSATAGLIAHISGLRRRFNKGPGFITASIAAFIPKPHTPFQWVSMEGRDVLKARQRFLRDRNPNRKKVKLDFHDLETSILEGVISRGDRRLGQVLEKAWGMGARFDGWGEFFNAELWHEAFRAAHIEPDFYINRARPHEEILPWDIIDIGISKARLLKLSTVNGDSAHLNK